MNDFLDKDDLCSTIQTEITPLVRVEDFESMYKEGGRPPVSPKLLILVLIMQYIERLSDRAAAANLRYRIDWKIAFGLDLDFKGINHTTLVYFRDRLLSNDKASYAFDQVLEHLVNVGLVRKNAKQRIDSTHVVGQVRELSRIELLHETLRLFCNDLEPTNLCLGTELTDALVYYGDKISIRGISDAQKDRFIVEAGLAMKAFICWADSSSVLEKIKELESYLTLKKVFSQNFVGEDDAPPDPHKPVKLKKVATGKGHVSSPHDPESRYASKGKKSWLGYKAQVSETVSDQESDVNFITHINANEATDHDGAEVPSFIKSQNDAGVVPEVVFADTHYNTSDNIVACAKSEVTLMGPVAPVPARKNESKTAGFEVVQSSDSLSIRCPEGEISETNSQWNDERVKGKFSKEKCTPCTSHSSCAAAKNKGVIVVRPESELLKERRALMETEEFKKKMFNRNGIEGTISGLVRGQRMRNCRFRGISKLQLQLKFTGAAANIVRLHRKRHLEMKMAA
jgi:transposase